MDVCFLFDKNDNDDDHNDDDIKSKSFFFSLKKEKKKKQTGTHAFGHSIFSSFYKELRKRRKSRLLSLYILFINRQ